MSRVGKTEGGSHHYTQVKQGSVPGEARKNLQTLIESRKPTNKERVKSLINRANTMQPASGKIAALAKKSIKRGA